MIIVLDIRDLISTLRSEYAKILNPGVLYDELDYRNFLTWLIKKYYFNQRAMVMDFNENDTKMNYMSGLVLSYRIYGNVATFSDCVYMSLKDIGLSIYNDKNYTYSIMTVGNNLVVGRHLFNY